MAGENLLKKAEDWDSLATGLEAVDGAIRLATGSGGWDANSLLDMTSKPSSPWTEGGSAGSSAIVDGELLQIIDDSGASARFFILTPADWNEDLSSGLTLHFKGRASFSSTLEEIFEEFGDASNRYLLWFDCRDFRITGSSTFTFGADKYPHMEIFVSVNNNVAAFWIWNPITNVWDVIASGRASAAIATDDIAFGAAKAAATSESYWKLLRWKSAIEATPFKSTTLVSRMGVVAKPTGFIVNGLGDFRTSIAGSATLKAAYNINDIGWSGLFDDIEALNLFLAANPITIIDPVNSIDLRMTHASNGKEQSQFWPGEGPNLTGVGGEGGGSRSRFARPLGVKGRVAA